MQLVSGTRISLFRVLWPTESTLFSNASTLYSPRFSVLVLSLMLLEDLQCFINALFFLAGAEEPAGNVLEDLKDLRLEVLQSNNCRGTSVVLEVPAHLKDLSRTRGTCPSQGSADASPGSPSSAEP